MESPIQATSNPVEAVIREQVAPKTLHAEESDSPRTEVYVLGLKEGKYYVGKTTNVARRRLEHFTGAGAAWTKLYQPVRVLKTMPDEPFKEDQVTLQYMKEMGIENVRGGVYCKVNLSESEILEIQRKIFHEKKACLNCGSLHHWIKDCCAELRLQEMELAPVRPPTAIPTRPPTMSNSPVANKESACIVQ